jgi:hypothetical protein
VELVPEGAVGHFGLLFDVADAYALRDDDFARGGFFFSEDAAKERGFACAVGADEAYFVAVGDREADVMKYFIDTEGFG